jgi:hypothetical protein
MYSAIRDQRLLWGLEFASLSNYPAEYLWTHNRIVTELGNKFRPQNCALSQLVSVLTGCDN